MSNVRFSLGGANRSQNPGKISSYQLRKAQAEAKKLSDQKELDSVLEEYNREHKIDNSDDTPSQSPPSLQSHESKVGPQISGKRPFATSKMKMSGVGTLQPIHGVKRPFGGPGQAGPSKKQQTEDQTGPTIKIENLPPGFSTKQVKTFLESLNVGSKLTILNVEPIIPTGPSFGRSSDRASKVKVTFGISTNATDVDAAIKEIPKKYLGRGHYAQSDKWYASAGQDPNIVNSNLQPGVQKVDLGFRFGFTERVVVHQPTNLSKLRLIHATIENVIKGGAEFEAALMSHPQIESDERYAWLYDSSTPDNIYYKWRLRQVLSGHAESSKDPVRVFADSPEWVGPKTSLPFEHASTRSDIPAEILRGTDFPFLNPQGIALLAFLLMELYNKDPNSNGARSCLQKARVAAITEFAFDHMECVDEVVQLLISNVFNPLCLAKGTAPFVCDPGRDAPLEQNIIDPAPDKYIAANAKWTAIIVISDVLMTATLRAVPSAHRYTTAIGKQLEGRKVFYHLGRISEALNIKGMRWFNIQNGISKVLNAWRANSVFTPDRIEHFHNEFKGGPKAKERETVKAPANKRLQGGALDGSSDHDLMDSDSVGTSAQDSNYGATSRSSTPQDLEKVYPEILEYSANPTACSSADAHDIPGETAAARARRLRPRAEDMFASDEE